ncbi:hypothetical protein ACEQ8H_007381 [Pleosporales sp. CAS-2024a]
MKLSWGLFGSSLCCAASAADPIVSPATARLIMAQRLGLARFHSLDHADADTIRHLNTYGGRRQTLLAAAAASSSPAHLLVWVEGGHGHDASVVVGDGAPGLQRFTISAAPSPAQNDRLIADLIRQAEALPAQSDPQQRTYQSTMEMAHMLPTQHKVATYNEYLNVLRIHENSNMAPADLAALYTTLTQKASELGFPVTIVSMPTSNKSSKRTTNPWGTYALPSTNGARRKNSEAFMSLSTEPSSSPAPPVSGLDHLPVITSQASNDTGPVRGILPSCFNSKSACEKRTHGCSGHGECTLLHKGKGSGKDRQTLDCYGCACKPTYEHSGEDKGMESKRKVTYWGGPACQKKDISVQFWLFVLVGVSLAFLVSSGIGMLYSMGSQELPSVIGAGVSGPVRK